MRKGIPAKKQSYCGDSKKNPARKRDFFIICLPRRRLRRVGSSSGVRSYCSPMFSFQPTLNNDCSPIPIRPGLSAGQHCGQSVQVLFVCRLDDVGDSFCHFLTIKLLDPPLLRRQLASISRQSAQNQSVIAADVEDEFPNAVCLRYRMAACLLSRHTSKGLEYRRAMPGLTLESPS